MSNNPNMFKVPLYFLGGFFVVIALGLVRILGGIWWSCIYGVCL